MISMHACLDFLYGRHIFHFCEIYLVLLWLFPTDVVEPFSCFFCRGEVVFEFRASFVLEYRFVSVQYTYLLCFSVQLRWTIFFSVYVRSVEHVSIGCLCL